MEPPTKKRKVNDGTSLVSVLPPIAFKSSDLNPDARLIVFDAEFHVHSVILRLHSGFFRKFLDSAEQFPATAIEANPFKYNYISVVDVDGEWGLEKATLENQNSGTEAFNAANANIKSKDGLNGKRTAAREEKAFERMLFAMYSKPYTLASMVELQNLTRLADFYLALPIVSSSLYQVLLSTSRDDSGLILGISSQPFRYLKIAKKLRHPILFREALIHCVSRWDGGPRPFGDNEDLNNVVAAASGRISRLVVKANQEFLAAQANDIRLQNLMFGYATHFPINYLLQSRDYYVEMQRRLDARVIDQQNLRKALNALLENKTTLNRRRLGIQAFGMGLLCAEISDEDLPWNTTETDW